MADRYDAVVVGSGPNGLAAAVTLAGAGLSVLVVEASRVAGGGLRTEELTLPGFLHDTCASVLPLAVASPFLSELGLERHGLKWIRPPTPLTHALDGARAVTLEHSVDETASGLGADGPAYRRLLGPIVDGSGALVEDLLRPIRVPRNPLVAARFGIPALLPAAVLVRTAFRHEPARALIAGLAAHSGLPLGRSPTSAFALVLAMLAHAVGWPVVEGGSRRLAQALVARLRELGGEVETGFRVQDVDDLPASRFVLLDLTPRQVLAIAGHRFPPPYRRRLAGFRYGPGVFKVDYALSEPIPWLASACRRAGTVHVGRSFGQIAAGERQAWRGSAPSEPHLVVTQPSLFDPSRAPEGSHTAWAYCRVPHGSSEDMSGVIDDLIEARAPGFRDVILSRRARTAAALALHNPNYVGGDIGGGVQDLGQLFSRPTSLARPYATADPRIFICSSSTPPGGGVHGLCGHYAAQAAIRAHTRAARNNRLETR